MSSGTLITSCRARITLPARPGPGGLAAEKEAAHRDDLLAGFETFEDLDEIASRRPHLHGALGKLALFAVDRGIHDHPLPDGLHSGLRHHRDPLTGSRLD